jgi:cytochrome P450 family 138
MTLPPGPRAPALVQTLAGLARQRPYVERARRRHGNLFTMRIIGFGTFVVVADPALIKQVFTEDPKVLHAGGERNPLGPVLGEHSLLVIDEDRHLEQRKLLLPPFHGKRMQAYEELIEEIAAEEIDRWPRDVPFATAMSFRRITLRAILRAVFGAQGDEVADLERVLPPFMDLGSIMSTLGRPLQRDLGRLSPWGRFLRARADVDARLDRLIERARIDPALEDRSDVLALLVQATHTDGTPMANAEIRDQLLTLLAAGHETTAATLAWAVERLRRHPEVTARLVEEADLGGRELRDATIREVQRQRPVIAFSARTTLAPYELGDHTLPENVRIALAASLTHFDPRLFPEPDRFHPDRFLDAKPDTYAWIPFGGGIRRCIGAAFAHMEMDVVLRTLLARVRLDAAPDEPPAGWKFRGVASTPDDGGLAVARPRRRVAVPA